MKIATLILEDYKKRGTRANTNFDSYEYFGLNVIIDSIKRKLGYDVGYCSIKKANDFDVLLVSLTSVIDVYNLVYTFSKHGIEAKEIEPKVIVGGQGVVNIKTYVEYGDYFVFGRGEDEVINIINSIENNEQYQSSSVFNRQKSSFDDNYRMCQTKIYPYEVNEMREGMLGCPNKCFYCQYSFSREYHNQPNNKYQDTEYITGEEQTFDDLEIKDGRVYVSAIDGFTERLRETFNKNITDKQIVEKLKTAQTADVNSRVSLKLYNICGYPTEDKKSYDKFIEMIQSADMKKEGNDVKLHILLTPFSAEPLTPAQYLPMDLKTNYRKYFQKKYVGQNGYVWKGNNITIYIMKYINTNYALFQRALVNRGEENDQGIIEAIVNNRKFQRLSTDEKMHNLRKQVDVDRFSKQHKIGDSVPWDYIQSYIPRSKINKMAKKLHGKLKI